LRRLLNVLQNVLNKKGEAQENGVLNGWRDEYMTFASLPLFAAHSSGRQN